MMSFLYSLRVMHGRLYEWRINRLPLLIERLKNPHAIYLVLTPEHGNLGDHAIAESEKSILNELGIPYIEFTGQKLEELIEKKCLDVMNGRPIFINGGGNLGTLWPSVEMMMQCIVQNNPRSVILLFPNTIYYEDTDEGLEKLNQSRTVYNSHTKLKLYAREKMSYDVMKNLYTNVGLAPDMVLRMNKSKKGTARKGCVLCLRKDREKTISHETERIVNAQVALIFGDDIQSLDMVRPYSISIENRISELNIQYDFFRHAELVVTDRLHGMIFSAITGTPCIVINSKSPKVRGCYEWIKNLPYIRFCDNANNIASIYKSIPKQDWQYDNSKFIPQYAQLIEDIKKAIKRKYNASN